MDVTNLTIEQKRTLKSIKDLEGKSMKCSELEDFLDSIDCFDENDWYFTCDDYNDYDEDGEVADVIDMIHSGDDVECPEPYIAPDGSELHWDGDLLYEIWLTHDGDPRCHPSGDDVVEITEVDIKVPEEYLN